MNTPKVETMASRTITERLRCRLTMEQLNEVAGAMNDAMGQIEQLEADAMRVSGEYKAKIKGQEALLIQTRNTFQTGHELRDVECRVDFDVPIKGKKTITRLDTKEVVRNENMTHDEKNPELPLKDQVPAPAPGQPLANVGEAVTIAQNNIAREQHEQAKENKP